MHVIYIFIIFNVGIVVFLGAVNQVYQAETCTDHPNEARSWQLPPNRPPRSGPHLLFDSFMGHRCLLVSPVPEISAKEVRFASESFWTDHDPLESKPMKNHTTERKSSVNQFGAQQCSFTGCHPLIVHFQVMRLVSPAPGSPLARVLCR